MGCQVLITDAALGDLREIVEFVAYHDPAAATRLGEKLISRAISLSTFPERHGYHDFTRGIRKMPVPPYLLYYTFDKAANSVYILHFWHSARRTPGFGT